MIKEDKGYYDKRYVYLDYLERGKKIKNGGFYKWEVKGDTCRVMIHIRGLYPTDTLQGEILIMSRGISYPADHISLHLGNGEYLAVWNANNLSGTEIGTDKCDGLVIRLSENRMLKGVWNDSQETEETVPISPGKREEPSSLVNPILNEEPVIQPQVVIVNEPAEETNVLIKEEEVSRESNLKREESVPETVPLIKEEQIMREPVKVVEADELIEQVIPNIKEDSAINEQESEIREAARKPIMDKPLSLSADKWQQLKSQFITITPFQDGREYLSITPRDFTVLPGKYQILVQNSFLLHGYYNYGHVVLVREKDRLEEKYYLGVPGVYYDREKQAALMFGFEGFEGGSTKTQEGGFGYYMKRVEI